MSDLAYLKGALADGHIYDLKSRIRIVVRQKGKEWLEEAIAPILENISRKKAKIIKTPDGVHMIYVYMHKEALNKSILEVLMKPLHEIKFGNLEEELSFLRGFFDAEGSLYHNKNEKADVRAIMYQKDIRPLQYAKSILDKIGIESKLYGPYKNGKNSIHRLIVFRKKNVDAFIKNVNPYNRSKFAL